MPFFSFLINNHKNKDFFTNLKRFDENIVNEQKYYSKNSNLWKLLNNKKYKKFIKFADLEKRKKIEKIGKNILFCLPPNYGLGDAVEYALGIKSVINKKNFNTYGIAFTDRYRILFEKYFEFNNLYTNIISFDDLNKYDTIFHFTLEIDKLKLQKYNRQNIELSVVDYFNTKLFRFKNTICDNSKIKKITIFPISKSPIRTMPVDLLNYIIFNFSKKYNIDVVVDNDLISEYTLKKIDAKNKINILRPKDLKSLLSLIEKIDFGIFMDSGPLHFAKIFNIKGIVIIGSVEKNILLNGFNSINSINGNYRSEYCNGPCGLTNAFFYKNKSGCFDSLKINRNIILNSKNTKEFQRGNLKKNYNNLLKSKVNCLKHISKLKVVKIIRDNIEL